MVKTAHVYLDIDPYRIIETNFHQDKSEVSESLFSIANEYSGVRGFFEEGYSGKSLIGTYFNGLYDYAKEDIPNAFKGIVKRTHFTLNSINFLKCQIECDGEILDLNKSIHSNFKRILDFKNGLLTRSFIWHVNDKKIHITFNRIFDMINCEKVYQRISFCSDKETTVKVRLYLDGTIVQHGFDKCHQPLFVKIEDDMLFLAMKTIFTNQNILSSFSCNYHGTWVSDQELPYLSIELNLGENIPNTIYKEIINITDLDGTKEHQLVNLAKEKRTQNIEESYLNTIKSNQNFFTDFYDNCDIEIGGSDFDQQGIRYCLFQLAQTNHGYDPNNNLGAKGLTGEAYSGHAFWDSEIFCLPFYLFTNQSAAKNLLMFRYKTLEQAKKRAIDLDCIGACYPIATRNGEEACSLWQHASSQFQPSTAVFYAIMHYMRIYEDDDFFINYGLEMIIEVAKFLLSRGSFNSDHTRFGFYGVMGPDEFQIMVNHNTYTNFMASQVFDFILENQNKYSDIYQKFGLDNKALELMEKANQKMVILYDEKTHLFEQHQGFFDLPHVDVNTISESELPIYNHWSYDRIFRNDLIKQPDVLMFMFLYDHLFSLEELKANYDFYEPRCIHESSLSSSIHSIIASELGYDEAALTFFKFATRLDLDDYNCNTCEGLHLTSIASAWMNIVYGFGGLRSDDNILKLAPKLPQNWDFYSFKIIYKGHKLKITKTKQQLIITNDSTPINLNIDGIDYLVKQQLVLEN